jgi:hypothetical protein
MFWERGAVAVTVTLAINRARVYPIVSLAAASLIAALLYALWVHAERPRGISEAERFAEL